MEAAERFRQDDESPVIAHDLRVSVPGQCPVGSAVAQSLVAEWAPGPGLEGPGIAAAAQ